MIIDKMTTNYYKTLSFMYDNKILINDEYMIPLTQNEISIITKINKVTINKLFKEYIEDEMLYKKNSRYYFTDKAMNIIKKIKNIKE
jgi:hypothetical protein